MTCPTNQRDPHGAELEHFTDPAAYRAAVDDYLLANLGACNQLYTVIQGLTHESMARRHTWLARFHRDGDTCGLAVIHSTPPLRSLIVTAIDDERAHLLVDALERCAIAVTDITGEHDSVAAVLAAMQPAPPTRLRAELGNHLLEAAPVVPACVGAWRAAVIDDMPLLIGWERAFLIECGFPVIEAQLHDTVAQRLAGATILYWLWEVDQTPAAMAVGRLLPPSARIGPVYTAPAFRGRGCAGALVARLSCALMAGGATGISLFTDLANPTSNAVYRRLGFLMIGKLIHLEIEQPASAPRS